MRPTLVGSLIALMAAPLLFACQPQAPGGEAAPAPADAPEPAPTASGPFDGVIRAVGTEPFWGLQIEADELILEEMDGGRTTAPHGGPEVSGDQAVWRGESADTGAMVVTLRQAECSDGMSDLVYAYEAQVELGGRTLSGCAAKADAMPREGG